MNIYTCVLLLRYYNVIKIVIGIRFYATIYYILFQAYDGFCDFNSRVLRKIPRIRRNRELRYFTEVPQAIASE